MNAEKHFQEITLSNIQPSPMNPRKKFEGKKFDELVASISKVGVIEPILVRPNKPLYEDNPDCFPLNKRPFEIVAGERRYRASCIVASKNGGPEKFFIPSMVQEMTGDEAFDLMTIENLQREDLTELEEAQGFKLYLDKKGKDALPELAERVSLTPQYISRRLMVLSLPTKALKAWEKGEIKYGHCEQLCRLKDKKLILEYLDRLLIDNFQKIITVKQLKKHIDEHAIPLKSAKFNKEEAGCLTCQSNTEYQSQLFEEQLEGNAHCTNSVCFKKNQSVWLTKNWKKFGKTFGTNDFRFETDLNWKDHNDFQHEGKPTEKCTECSNFITLIEINGKVAYGNKQSCIGDKSCFSKVIKESEAQEIKAIQRENNVNYEGSNDGGTNQDQESPRVSWHGRHFREEFYKTRIPEMVNNLPIDDVRVLRLSLMSILISNYSARDYYYDNYVSGKDVEHNCFEMHDEKRIWNNISEMTIDDLLDAHREMANIIIMQQDRTSPDMRHAISEHIGIDLAKEWRITKEYLDKKTTKEIMNIVAKFGIDKDEKALIFLHENLNKKRGRFDTCKKAELVSIFLDSGLDLAGIVPDEILNV